MFGMFFILWLRPSPRSLIGPCRAFGKSSRLPGRHMAITKSLAKCLLSHTSPVPQVIGRIRHALPPPLPIRRPEPPLILHHKVLTLKPLVLFLHSSMEADISLIYFTLRRTDIHQMQVQTLSRKVVPFHCCTRLTVDGLNKMYDVMDLTPFSSSPLLKRYLSAPSFDFCLARTSYMCNTM